MKTYFLPVLASILCVIIGQTSFSQSETTPIKLKWGEEFQQPLNSIIRNITVTANNEIYVEKVIRRGLKLDYAIDRFDNELSRVLSKKIEFPVQKYPRYPISLFIQKNGSLMFSHSDNKKLKTATVFKQEFDAETLTPLENLETCFEIDHPDRKYFANPIETKTSIDGSKIMLYSTISGFRDDTEKLIFFVYDQNMNPIWNNSLSFPYKKEESKIKNIRIDNEGNVHLIGVVTDENAKTGLLNNNLNVNYHVFSFVNGGTELKERMLKFKDKNLRNIRMSVNNGILICAGLFSTENHHQAEGVYMVKLNAQTEETLSSNFEKFDIELITQNTSNKVKEMVEKRNDKGKKIGLSNFILNDIIIKENGGIILLAERYKKLVQSESSGNATFTKTYHYYDDIIALSMSPNGEIVWSTKIQKKQETVNDFGVYSSFTGSFVKDNLYIIFNDSPENFDRKPSDEIVTYKKKKGTVTALVSIDNMGNQKKQRLYSSEYEGFLIRPLLCTKIGTNEILLTGQNENGYRFVKLQFN